MKPALSLGICLLSLTLWLGVASADAQTSTSKAPPDHWWDQKNLIKTLDLQPVQRQKLVSIAADTQAILATQQALDLAQAKLTALFSDKTSTETQVFDQIDTVKQARINLQHATLRQDLALRQVLTPTQQQRFDALYPPEWMVK